MRTLQALYLVYLLESGQREWNHASMSETPEQRLVTTGAAARALGIDRSTLTRWAAAGVTKPAVRTAGGHMRWDLDQLRDQLAELQATDARGSR